jgi:hypothetical protein
MFRFIDEDIRFGEKVQAAERVPESGVGKPMTGKYFTVVGAVVHDLSFGASLAAFTFKAFREKYGCAPRTFRMRHPEEIRK